MAIDKLNEANCWNLQTDPHQYELFAARKDGTRDDGLPSLENNQLISKTQIKRFILFPLYKIDYIHIPIETKDTISSIKSNMNIYSTKSKEIIDVSDLKLDRKFSFCGCFYSIK